MKKSEFYDIQDILKHHPDAHYYTIIGKPNYGNIYFTLVRALEQYRLTKTEQFAYIRRFKQDIKPKQMSELFSVHRQTARIASLFDNEWDRIVFKSGKFYLARYDEDSQTVEHEKYPIGFAFSYRDMKRYKSISFPNITTFIFDGFLSYYEFEPFQDIFSTLIRQRNNVKIFMIDNIRKGVDSPIVVVR